MSNLNIAQRRVGDITIIDLEGKVTIGETNRQLRLLHRSRLAGELPALASPVERLPLHLHSHGGEVDRQHVDVEVRGV